MPSKLIKLIAQIITEPLRKIINSTIKNNLYPDLLKNQLVNPSYKNPENGSK